MKISVAKALTVTFGITCLTISIVSGTPLKARQSPQSALPSAGGGLSNRGNWSDWKPLPGKAGAHTVDYSLKETSVSPNGHESWDGKFRNRDAKNVKIKLRCFFVDHRGDEQETTFTLYVGGRSTSAPVADVVPLSYAPVRIELAEISYPK